MMKKPVLVAMATLLTLGLIPMGSARADNRSDNRADEARFVTKINALRATRGVRPLKVHVGLRAKARSWAGTMAARNAIWHSSLSDGITANWQKLGENVGRGGTVDGLAAAFVNSPLHYANLVDPAFRSVGIGVVRNASGVLFVAEEFMQPRARGAYSSRPAAARAGKKAVHKKAVKKVVGQQPVRVKSNARRFAARATCD